MDSQFTIVRGSIKTCALLFTVRNRTEMTRQVFWYNLFHTRSIPYYGTRDPFHTLWNRKVRDVHLRPGVLTHTHMETVNQAEFVQLFSCIGSKRARESVLVSPAVTHMERLEKPTVSVEEKSRSRSVPVVRFRCIPRHDPSGTALPIKPGVVVPGGSMGRQSYGSPMEWLG